MSWSCHLSATRVLLILISALTEAIKVALLCSAISLGVSLEKGVGIDF